MKVELDIHNKPEVQAIAEQLNIDVDTVVGRLIRVWAWFDRHTDDGNAQYVTPVTLDRYICNGHVTHDEQMCNATFSKAMENVGWLRYENGILTMPKFDKHTSSSAKNRANTGLRVKRYRNGENVTDVTPKPLPEKRREEKILDVDRDIKNSDIGKDNKTLNSSNTRESNFEIFWKHYPKKVGKGAAEKSWSKINLAEFPKIIAAIATQKKSDQWMRDGGQFIPNPATWLNEKRWLDEGVQVDGAASLSSAGRQTAAAAQEFIQADDGANDDEGQNEIQYGDDGAF